MSEGQQGRVDRDEFYGQLTWGLRRLALYGELAQVETSDPHVRYEAKCHAKTTIGQLARKTAQEDLSE